MNNAWRVACCAAVTSRVHQICRALGACVALFAWFAVSNHCGLAMIHALHGMERTAHTCCPSHSGSVPTDSPDAPSKVCCKQLRLLPIEEGAKLINVHEETCCFEADWSLAFAVHAAEEARATSQVGTAGGPPRARSFAEVVLQRSLLSHAPPAGA